MPIGYKSPPDHFPASMIEGVEHVNSPAMRQRRLAAHRLAVSVLKPLLKPGDRIRATKGECGARPATYTFQGWDGQWIVSRSGIDTILPASVTHINGEPLPQ